MSIPSPSSSKSLFVFLSLVHPSFHICTGLFEPTLRMHHILFLKPLSYFIFYTSWHDEGKRKGEKEEEIG